MSDRNQETEAKFYLLNTDTMTTRLQELKAQLTQPRVLETNLRFDLPDRSLTSAGRVLRLRHDKESRLTYKGPSENRQGVLDHEEIEFAVEDFESARRFLEALGYQQSLSYEKYRTTYELDETKIMLDELPFGNFIEIEAETDEQIHAIATRLSLDWSTAIGTSYVALFENVKKALELSFQDISFANFEGINVTARDLRVRPADGD